MTAQLNQLSIPMTISKTIIFHLIIYSECWVGVRIEQEAFLRWEEIIFEFKQKWRQKLFVLQVPFSCIWYNNFGLLTFRWRVIFQNPKRKTFSQQILNMNCCSSILNIDQIDRTTPTFHIQCKHWTLISQSWSNICCSSFDFSKVF